MKNIQILKANHPSNNGVIIADDTDTVFPNVDKNIRKTQKYTIFSTNSTTKPNDYALVSTNSNAK